MRHPPCVIVVPIYNESQSLPTFIAQVEDAANTDVQFLLVDNGSTDEQCARLLAPGGLNWSSVRLDPNVGFGGAVIEGVRRVQATHIGWMPANLKVHPREAVRMAKGALLAPNALLKASRRGRSPIAHVKTVLAGFAQSIVAGTAMMDSGGTPTICPRAFLLSLPHPPRSVAFESYVLFMARRLRVEIHRPPVKYGERLFGKSHWQRGLGSELRLLKDILRSLPSWNADVRSLR